MDRRNYLRAFGVGGVLSVAGCVEGQPTDASGSGTTDAVDTDGGTLTLASATTVHDSGLLGALVPGFEETFGASVKPVVRGSGGALRTARDGDCDVVLVHARPLEDPFLRDGAGINRRAVMRNDFLVVGPHDDPAGAAGQDPTAAFRAIADRGATFLSRGDRSGTHIRELGLWDAAGVEPSGRWYRETGQGMGSTLVAAREAGAYTLTDRGTFLTVQGADALVAHVAHGIEDPPALLRNEYAVIPTNPARHDVAYPLAMAFAGYLTGPARSRIARFRVDGQRAFRPVDAGPDPNFRQYVPSDWPG